MAGKAKPGVAQAILRQKQQESLAQASRLWATWAVDVRHRILAHCCGYWPRPFGVAPPPLACLADFVAMGEVNQLCLANGIDLLLKSVRVPIDRWWAVANHTTREMLLSFGGLSYLGAADRSWHDMDDYETSAVLKGRQALREALGVS